MNIFWIEHTVKGCAQSLCDRHVVKMSLEYTQILSSVHHFWHSPAMDSVYKPTHMHHPCVQWAGYSRRNYQLLLALAMQTLTEYSNRYLRRHKCCDLYYKEALLYNPIFIREDLTLPPACVHLDGDVAPEDWPSLVASYRNYYNYKYNSNREEVYWKKNRERPLWIGETV